LAHSVFGQGNLASRDLDEVHEIGLSCEREFGRGTLPLTCFYPSFELFLEFLRNRVCAIHDFLRNTGEACDMRTE
jgi:hypothetical protein